MGGVGGGYATGNDLLGVAAGLASLARGRSALTLPKREAPEGGAEGGEALYRVEVGRRHGLQPGNLVGALAHEGDLHGSQINGLAIRHQHTTVRLPANHPSAVPPPLRPRFCECGGLVAGVWESVWWECG